MNQNSKKKIRSYEQCYDNESIEEAVAVETASDNEVISDIADVTDASSSDDDDDETDSDQTNTNPMPWQ